jgi:hypothetical protein
LIVGTPDGGVVLAAVTVNVAPGDIADPWMATIEAEPALTAAASPCEPLVLLIEATAALDELHMTDVVRVFVE